MAILKRGDLADIAEQYAEDNQIDFETAYYKVRACNCGSRPNKAIQKRIDAKERENLLEIQQKLAHNAVSDFEPNTSAA
jgi:hypothetical protein